MNTTDVSTFISFKRESRWAGIPVHRKRQECYLEEINSPSLKSFEEMFAYPVGNSICVVCLLMLSIDMVLGSTCPTFTAWLNVDNEKTKPICGYGPCSNLDGFATVDVAPDASYVVFTVQISNSRDFVTPNEQLPPFSSAIPGSMSAFIYGPAPPGEEVMPGTAPLLTMGLDPPTVSMNTAVTQAQLVSSNMDTILR